MPQLPHQLLQSLTRLRKKQKPPYLEMASCYLKPLRAGEGKPQAESSGGEIALSQLPACFASLLLSPLVPQGPSRGLPRAPRPLPGQRCRLRLAFGPAAAGGSCAAGGDRAGPGSAGKGGGGGVRQGCGTGGCRSAAPARRPRMGRCRLTHSPPPPGRCQPRAPLSSRLRAAGVPAGGGGLLTTLLRRAPGE